jgi:hypothetical protein
MYLPQFLNDLERLEDVNADFDLQGPVLWLGVDENDVTEQGPMLKNFYSCNLQMLMVVIG